MTHDEICTYELCKLAKEKGFDIPTIGYYLIDTKDLCKTFVYNNWNDNTICYSAPTQSLLQRWLREEKGIIVDVVLDWQYNIEAGEIRYQYRIGSVDRMTIEGGIKTKGLVFDKRFTTYELALEDALKYALENLV